MKEDNHCRQNTSDMRKTIITALLAFLFVQSSWSQELQAKVNINHAQIQGTDVSVFENLQETLEQFINDKQWTNLQFQKNERIVCNFNITVTKYDASSNQFTTRRLRMVSSSMIRILVMLHLLPSFSLPD